MGQSRAEAVETGPAVTTGGGNGHVRRCVVAEREGGDW
jgi:hypothetical protein